MIRACRQTRGQSRGVGMQLAVAACDASPPSPASAFLAGLGLEEHRSALKSVGFKNIEQASRMSSDNLLEFKSELANLSGLFACGGPSHICVAFQTY